ncbi:hypothetical protein GCM10027064_01450 [Microbacterium petrolearium]
MRTVRRARSIAVTRHEAHALVVEGRALEREIVGGAALEVRREADAVIGEPALVADHRDPPRSVVAGQQALDEAMRDHAGADHDDLLRDCGGGSAHAARLGTACFRPRARELPRANETLTSRRAAA